MFDLHRDGDEPTCPSQDRPPLERVTASAASTKAASSTSARTLWTLPDGRSALREVVEHAEVVAIVPIDSDGNVLLVRQYRLPAAEALLEIPAGGVDDGESVEDAAQRELQEETGYRAERLDRIGGFFVSPGYCTEFIHVFLATDLSRGSGRGDEDEDISLERMPVARRRAPH